MEFQFYIWNMQWNIELPLIWLFPGVFTNKNCYMRE